MNHLTSQSDLFDVIIEDESESDELPPAYCGDASMLGTMRGYRIVMRTVLWIYRKNHPYF